MLNPRYAAGTNFGSFPICKRLRRHCITCDDEACWLWKPVTVVSLPVSVAGEVEEAFLILETANSDTRDCVKWSPL